MDIKPNAGAINQREFLQSEGSRAVQCIYTLGTTEAT
jgi:hypothetical protein